jgi:hypothetical protein
MNALFPYLIALHQQDLLEEAELVRRARLSDAANPSVPAWRRSLGRLFASAARSLDASVETESESRPTAGRGANALPAR